MPKVGIEPTYSFTVLGLIRSLIRGMEKIEPPVGLGKPDQSRRPTAMMIEATAPAAAYTATVFATFTGLTCTVWFSRICLSFGYGDEWGVPSGGLTQR